MCVCVCVCVCVYVFSAGHDSSIFLCITLSCFCCMLRHIIRFVHYHIFGDGGIAFLLMMFFFFFKFEFLIY